MKQKFFNSIATKNGWRLTAIVLAFVLLALFGATSTTAQSKKQKRVTSVRLGSANEGSRVTVVSDSALNDYEAYRRGDRFYVKIPAANFASGVPNLRGAGFEDVQVQKDADSSIISFRLQPGTAARVDQRSNRLDVVFSTLGRSDNSGGTNTNVTGRAQNTTENRPDVAGSLPPSSTGSSRDGRDLSSSNQNRIERPSQGTLASQQSTAGSPQGSSGTASQANPAGSSPGANETATGSPSGATSTPESLLAPKSPGQPTTVEQQPAATAQGTTSSQNLRVRGGSAGQWLARNWLPVVIAALLLVGLPLLFVAYRRSKLKRNNRPRLSKESLVQPKNLGNVGFNETEFAALVDNAAPDIAVARTSELSESKVELFPLVPPSSETRRTEKTVETQPTKSVLHSLEATPLISEQPLPNTEVSLERTDFEVKKLLAGEDYDSSLINASDSTTRQMIAAQLLTALGDRSLEQNEPARRAFLNHGYFDEATRDLRTADSPAERAAAASKLGKVGSPLGTSHLIAALQDSAPEVRRSAVESLGQIGDSGAIQALNDLLSRETSRQLPEAVIRRAIESITVATAVRPAEKSAPRGAESPYDAPVFQGYEREALHESSVSKTFPETQASGTVNLVTPAQPLGGPSPQSVMEGGFAIEEERLRLQEEALLRAAEELERRRREAEAVRKQVEEEARIKAANEKRVRAEAEARLRADEAARRSEEEAARHRVEEEARLKVEREILARSEAEANQRAEEDARFRMEGETLRRAAEELARRRAEAETARLATEEARRGAEEEVRQRLAEEAHRRAEAEAQSRVQEELRRQAEEEMRLRVEVEVRRLADEEVRRRAEEQRLKVDAEERRRIAEERLKLDQEALMQAAVELTRRRAEVEEARRGLEEESRLLAAAREQMRMEDERRRQVEEERLRLEAEAQRRAQEERKRVEESARLQAEEEERRLAELDVVRNQAERQARQRAEQEQRIRAEIEVLRQAEVEQNKRIEAETRRRAEAEARLKDDGSRHQVEGAARVKVEEERLIAEEARMLAEEERRHRTEVEEHLREEESRRQSKDEARLRMQQEALQWAEETRLRAEEESRGRAEEQEARLEAERKSGRIVEETLLQAEPDQQAAWFDVPMDRQGGEETPHADESITGSAAAEETVAPSRQFQEPVEGIAVPQEKGLARFGEDSSIPSEIFKRLNSNESRERAAALAELAPIGGHDVFSFVSRAFDDESADVRNAAAHALYDMQLDRAASFTRALREGSPERRRSIGAALAASGLANNAINNLTGESREKTYDAFSLLFLMAKAGEVQPLMQAIEEHANVEVRLAVVKLLALSGQAEIVPAFRRLAVRGSLPSEVRSAVMEAIYQISSQARESAHSVA